MKKIISLILLAGCMLLTGCEHESPKIEEFGRTDLNFDNTSIIVPQAKSGLCGYEIVETDDGIDVILHYNKKE